MITDYEERLRELFGIQIDSNEISTENLYNNKSAKNRSVQTHGNLPFYNSLYKRVNTYKRRVFVHWNSYYLPDLVRGMTDTVKHIWINAKEYFKKHVFRHEKIHFKWPQWPESLVRQFHDSYDPYLPDVEFVYL